jgi:hypothetical protein
LIPRKRKTQGNKIGAPKKVIPIKQAMKIDLSKLSVQNSHKNKSPEELPPKRNKYLKIIRSQ